jgi:hypothetical protein
MGDAPGALGGAIPRDKALRDCCVSFPKRTILSSASVGIRAGDVTKNAYGSWRRISPPLTTYCSLWQRKRTSRFCPGEQ